jgi:hypothetical protein
VLKRRSEQSRKREEANDWRFDLSGAVLNRPTSSARISRGPTSVARISSGPSSATAAMEPCLPIVCGFVLLGGVWPARRERLIQRVEAALRSED